MYYSPSLFVTYNPHTQNYKEYTYDEAENLKDYFWMNYDNEVYTERRFIAKYGEIEYYSSRDEGLTRWAYQISSLLILACGCCIIVSICACCLQCILSRQNKRLEEKRALELSEIEGIGIEIGANNQDNDTES